MIRIRPAGERGKTQTGWLDSRHTFSFGDYHDPQNMGFSHLRVINEDRVRPGAGFPTHSHRDMEIITYVLEGALAHKDSTGTSSVIRVGDVQRMSAGTGISHSEYNASQTEPVHFLQIWIVPNETGLQPGYEQRSLNLEKNSSKWVLIAARDGREGAVKVHQDVELYLAAIPAGQQLNYRLKPGRQAWLQVTRGATTINGMLLGAGDGASVSEEQTLEVTAVQVAELLLFNLA
jgi:redox-sensitive bicupin YhaK (pirin superfamily)